MSENYEDQNELDLNEGSLRRGVEAVTDTVQAASDRFNRKLSPQKRYKREVEREKRKAGRNRERDDETLRDILKTEKSVEKHGVLGGKTIKRMFKREEVEQQMDEGTFDATKRAVRNKSKELLYDYDKVPDPTNVKNTVRGMVNVAGGLGGAAVRGLATDARRAARKVFGKKEKGVKEDMSVDTKDIIESIANQNRPKSDIKEMVYAALSEKINDRLDECKAVIAQNYFGQHKEYF